MKHDLNLEWKNLTLTELTDPVDSKTTVISGSNNSGKTLLLKLIYEKLGEPSYLFGANRFFNVDTMPQIDHSDQNFIHNIFTSTQETLRHPTNQDVNHLPFEQVSSRLTNDDRNTLCEIASELLGQHVELTREDPNNSETKAFYSIAGNKINTSSSGTRMLLYLLAIFLYKKFKYILIDEPELGLTPRIQNSLANILYDDILRQKYFPHLKHIYIATHSHIFLSRVLKHNIKVSRDKSTMKIERPESIIELHQLVFNQLGNSFEQLHLPSGFIIVEGKTDFKFIEKLLTMKFKNKGFNIIFGGGDGKIPQEVRKVINVLGDINKSPYKDRIITVFDKKHGRSNSDSLKRLGVVPDNIVIWENNGIEFYYPLSILRTIFDDSEMKISDMKMDSDEFSHNGIMLTKNKFCDNVVYALTGDEDLAPELESKLLSLIRKVM